MNRTSSVTDRSRRETASVSEAVAGIPVTHGGRVLYPIAGLTKFEMVRYYEAIADWLLPHLRGRPLTLKQCAPTVGQCRFLRHSGERAPAHVRIVKIQEQKKVGDYMIVDDVSGLVSLAQWNIVEFHTWNAAIDQIEKPNRVVIDLDPGPNVEPYAVVQAAHRVRAELLSLGLESWVYVTTGRTPSSRRTRFAPGRIRLSRCHLRGKS